VDTRNKIVDFDGAFRAAMQAKAEGKRLVISLGEYDPVLASHAERLAGRRADGCWQVVAVTPGENPLLPVAARCELVASLASVDCVTAFEQDPSLLAMAAGKAEVHDDRAQDAAARDALITHIHAKQKLTSAD
jgi:bifunctional ADP-heptose synthase (sugar kinase/adenylyltransferase)